MEEAIVQLRLFDNTLLIAMLIGVRKDCKWIFGRKGRQPMVADAARIVLDINFTAYETSYLLTSERMMPMASMWVNGAAKPR
jgi:hypothetical protein